MRTYNAISADGHLDGPVDWAKWLPEQYKSYAPKLVTHEDGGTGWQIEIGDWSHKTYLGAGLYCGARYDEFTKETARTYFNPDGSLRPGCGEPAQRLREQDQDGLDAEILYFHSVAGLAGLAADKKPEAHLVLTRMYNDWLADYCSVAPDRLIGNAVMPRSGVEDTIAEMERCKKLGLRAASIQTWPNGGGDPSPEDDRFWAAAPDIGMAISPHVTFGDGIMVRDREGVGPVGSVCGQGFSGGKPSVTIGQLTVSGVFDRFPNLRIYFAETQAMWLPGHLDWIDEFYQRWYTYHNIKLKKQPSQYIRDHCKFSFIHDRMAMKYRYDIGVDMLMWGSDFPHSVGTFPESRAILDELFEDVPEAERRQVLVGNVCDFFGLDPEKPLTPTP